MPMRLEIVTAERILFEGDVESVVAPGGEGELGVLPHHAAVMTTLQAGELRYRINGEENHYIVHGGFMDIRGDQVVVLADAAEHIDEIDEARAEEAIARAQERISSRGEEIDLERALASLRRAQIRLRVTRRRRRQRPVASGSVPQ
jgi:F-type H+-transporting ATPase subunit epsilon